MRVWFQSRLGFSGRLDGLNGMEPTTTSSGFQSRLGFSGRLDLCQRFRTRKYRRSFNPVLGFLVVSTITLNTVGASRSKFQSRLGFSGRLDVFGPIDIEGREIPFQSRLGFSGRLDASLIRGPMLMPSVSIPSWVFWSSRQQD